MTPRAFSSVVSEASFVNTPRGLNEPVFWKSSAFRNMSGPSEPHAKVGVRRRCPRIRSAARSMSSRLTIESPTVRSYSGTFGARRRMRNVRFRLAALLAASLAVTPPRPQACRRRNRSTARSSGRAARPVASPLARGACGSACTRRASSLSSTSATVDGGERVDVGRRACRRRRPRGQFGSRATERGRARPSLAWNHGRVERMKVGTGTFDVPRARVGLTTSCRPRGNRPYRREDEVTHVRLQARPVSGWAHVVRRTRRGGHGRAVTFVTSIDPSTHRCGASTWEQPHRDGPCASAESSG